MIILFHAARTTESLGGTYFFFFYNLFYILNYQ